MQKAIIIGATSGIGQEVARILVQQGWHIGIAGPASHRTRPDSHGTAGRYGRDSDSTPP